MSILCYKTLGMHCYVTNRKWAHNMLILLTIFRYWCHILPSRTFLTLFLLLYMIILDLHGSIKPQFKDQWNLSQGFYSYEVQGHFGTLSLGQDIKKMVILWFTPSFTPFLTPFFSIFCLLSP